MEQWSNQNCDALPTIPDLLLKSLGIRGELNPWPAI